MKQPVAGSPEFENFSVKFRHESGYVLCVLSFHTQNRPINILTFELMQELSEALDLPEVQDVDYLVLTSEKPGVFLAGADIPLIQNITEMADAREKAQAGKALFSKLRRIRGKTVAWVNGTCLGGGCELALFCDLIVMDATSKYQLGLPETKLGIIPGFGGTVLLPRRMGAKNALGLMLRGSSVDAKRGAKLRLVDAVAPEGAAPSVEAIQAALHRQKKKRPHFFWAGLKSALTPLIVFLARRQIEKEAKNYPALAAVCDVVRKSYFLPEAKSFEIESEAFAKVAVTETSKNLIRIFFLSEEAKKLGQTQTRAVRPITSVGVVGGGVMGVGIGLASAKSGLNTRIKDLKMSVLKNSLLSNRKASKKIWSRWVRDLQEKLHLQTDNLGFRHVDCVVEAVFEDVSLKKKIFADLEQNVSSECLLVTNTSSIPLADIEESLTRKDRFAGLHFFNPVLRMPLVEVIRSEHTSEATIHRLCQWVTRMGKVPLVCNDTAGFVVNRVLAFYLSEGIHLLADGVQPLRIEWVAKQFGMPMGPLRLLDEIGMDVAGHVLRILNEKHGPRYAPRSGFEAMATSERLGKKSQKGFYLYGGKKKELLDEDWCKKIRVQLSDYGADITISDEDIQDRLILPMIAEGCRVVYEKVVDSVDSIDVGMIFGAGFPPYRGGLMQYARKIGATTVMDRLTQFERTYVHAERFALGHEREVLLGP